MNEKIIGKITTEEELKGKINYSSYETNRDYYKLDNKPSIEGVELIDDKTFEELGLSEVSNIELKEIFNKIFN